MAYRKMGTTQPPVSLLQERQMDILYMFWWYSQCQWYPIQIWSQLPKKTWNFPDKVNSSVDSTGQKHTSIAIATLILKCSLCLLTIATLSSVQVCNTLISVQTKENLLIWLNIPQCKGWLGVGGYLSYPQSLLRWWLPHFILTMIVNNAKSVTCDNLWMLCTIVGARCEGPSSEIRHFKRFGTSMLCAGWSKVW